jgi:hypothetical protein
MYAHIYTFNFLGGQLIEFLIARRIGRFRLIGVGRVHHVQQLIARRIQVFSLFLFGEFGVGRGSSLGLSHLLLELLLRQRHRRHVHGVDRRDSR